MAHILIVDDSPTERHFLKSVLTENGYDISLAENAEQGIEMAKSEHPDLILLDIIMPRMDGLTMLTKLRQDDWGKEVPVMVLTNLSGGTEIAEAMKKSVYDFLVKTDWKLEDLVQKIKDKLE